MQTDDFQSEADDIRVPREAPFPQAVTPPREASEGRSPPTFVPLLTTCASEAEALRSKVSLQRLPLGERSE